MTSESRGAFRVEEWNEEAFSEVPDGPVLKKAHVKKTYSGDIEGIGVVEYLFIYTDDQTADIYGLERFSGRVDHKHGTFIFEHKGIFDHGLADMKWDILPHSGTGELRDIEGQVHFKAGIEEIYNITLKHQLNKEKHLWKKLTG